MSWWHLIHDYLSGSLSHSCYIFNFILYLIYNYMPEWTRLRRVILLTSKYSENVKITIRMFFYNPKIYYIGSLLYNKSVNTTDTFLSFLLLLASKQEGADRWPFYIHFFIFVCFVILRFFRVFTGWIKTITASKHSKYSELLWLSCILCGVCKLWVATESVTIH